MINKKVIFSGLYLLSSVSVYAGRNTQATDGSSGMSQPVTNNDATPPSNTNPIPPSSNVPSTPTIPGKNPQDNTNNKNSGISGQQIALGAGLAALGAGAAVGTGLLVKKKYSGNKDFNPLNEDEENLVKKPENSQESENLPDETPNGSENFTSEIRNMYEQVTGQERPIPPHEELTNSPPPLEQSTGSSSEKNYPVPEQNNKNLLEEDKTNLREKEKKGPGVEENNEKPLEENKAKELSKPKAQKNEKSIQKIKKQEKKTSSGMEQNQFKNSLDRSSEPHNAEPKPVKTSNVDKAIKGISVVGFFNKFKAPNPSTAHPPTERTAHHSPLHLD